MKDYSDYDMVAFASDVGFQNWVLDRAEEEYWENVLEVYSDKKKDIEAARTLLLSIDFRIQKPKEEVIEEHLMRTLKIIEKQKKGKIIPFRKWGWVAAAAIVLVSGYLLIKSDSAKDDQQEATLPKAVKDLEPGGDRAILTLADGTQVILDSANNGLLANQGSVTVIKLDDGQLSYKGGNSESGEVLYNTISTPAGGMYQLVLSDGTKVWLNAKSSLRFPTVFVGEERKVELQGEGYFEVAHKTSQPFFVDVEEMEIKVLGTHFNVSAYQDEPIIRTTLLEGSVEVTSDKGKMDLTPGQQARMDVKGQNLRKIKSVDLNKVMAWKNGEFIFEETELRDALKTLSRWYDFDVEYSGSFEPTFIYGSIGRSKNLSDVLKILEASGIHFRMERVGNVNKLIVLK